MEYPIHLYQNSKGQQTYWVAEYIDLPGCIGVGHDKLEALKEAEIFMKLWLDHAKEDGSKIPSPSDSFNKDYSGKFNLRVSKGLHRRLSIKAAHENVSLNTLCSNYLERGLASDFQFVSTKHKEEYSYDYKPKSEEKQYLLVHDHDFESDP